MKKLPTAKAIFLLINAIQAPAALAAAIQFSYLDPAYTQEIFAGPIWGVNQPPQAPPGSYVQNAGMVWGSSGNLITKQQDKLLVYDTNASAIHQGTNIHPVINTYTVAGLSANLDSIGITKGRDSLVYANTNLGLQRIDASFSSATTVATPSQLGGSLSKGYGITTLSDGRIAFASGPQGNKVYAYNPGTSLTNLLFDGSQHVGSDFFDDIEASATGYIALAAWGTGRLLVIDYLGALINTVNVKTDYGHHPDGLAFGNGIASPAIFSNNNDGSISRFDFNSNYSSLQAVTDIATTAAGSRAYGDLAACGPDGSFYVTQYGVGNNLHGNDTFKGTHWDNGVQNIEASIVKISSSTPGGNLCTAAIAAVPEPSGVYLTGLALLCLFVSSRRYGKFSRTNSAPALPV